MNISEFVSNYRNHPVLFIGTGVSLRYLESSYSWDGLLKHIAFELTGNNEDYLDLKLECREEGSARFDKLATMLSDKFEVVATSERNGKFKYVNDIFYENAEKDIFLSRLKIYLSEVLRNIEYRDGIQEELTAFRRMRKNIGSIITTNYDLLIEDLFQFTPIVGNNLLLSNQYGSVYKIHGCVTDPTNIIITENDYEHFKAKYELIRAQLLSLFIHNPIIFIGYSVGDQNIKELLQTIFNYVDYNSEQAEVIRSQFLLIEYQTGSDSTEIVDHDIVINENVTVRINKIKTDNYVAVYDAVSSLELPVSAMDIRKVQKVWKKIVTGGSISVKITEDIDSLQNGDLVLAVGSEKTISYEYQNLAEMMANYFEIIEEDNRALLRVINKQRINSNQYFPIYAFGEICHEIERLDELQLQQQNKLKSKINSIPRRHQMEFHSISDIFESDAITASQKEVVILWNYYKENISSEDLKGYLLQYSGKLKSTNYKFLLCAYDFFVCGGEGARESIEDY
ncbi:SIR2 family protein [Halodesulfovibrio aestuarii]|uniref:SIR2-like domain-containing protein n=1 Tax=Halodesulfovibrio aestuarii TaxID=126333 RepID=A0A8G2C7Y8_9BACT|nr:SIR2 family protein [Halodesulfovibrio aestuarii]SHI72881.1 SIR2-like domain-containing protein [Halodesulfovibrio aestuarii]